jgi:hypothetical protein
MIASDCPPLNYGSPGPGLIGRTLARPPGRVMHLATLGAMIGLLEAFSAPGCYIKAASIFLLLWLVLIAAWCVRIIAVLIARQPPNRWQWAVTPIIGAVTFALLWLEVPMYLRFAVSRNDLTHLAQRAITAGPRPMPAWGTGTVNRAGAYDVIVGQVSPGGEVDFVVPGTFFFRSCSGFTYCPSGSPSDPEGSFEPLDGPWFVWHTSW